MNDDLKKNELIAVQGKDELRFSHYDDSEGERIPWGYILDTSKNPPEKYEPHSVLSILVHGYWEKSGVTE
jgi:hypothetical protein